MEYFVISDLHLGGAPPSGADPGFQMMGNGDALADFIRRVADTGATLVINGDFVDFLAESHNGSEHWLPFCANEEQALHTLERVVSREPRVFEALKKLKGRLLLLIGNHDIELALPRVRCLLRGYCGPFDFRCDGEALVLGDAIVEHGNRVDAANAVDHARLLEVRQTVARGRDAPDFLAPFGSHLVARVVNRIKTTWPFIDLLKPEGEALILLLVALDPGQIYRILDVVDVAGAQLLGRQAVSLRRPVGQRSGPAEPCSEPLTAALLAVLSPEDAAALEDELAALEVDDGAAGLSALRAPVSGLGAAAAVLSYGRALWEAMAIRLSSGSLEDRLAHVQRAVRALQGDHAFDPMIEPDLRYMDAARELWAPSACHPGFRHVLMGHTHQVKHVIERCADGVTRGYHNSGTWANLMEFPADLLDADPERARDALRRFARDLASGEWRSRHLRFSPTWTRVDLREDGRAHVETVTGWTAGTGLPRG